MVPANIDADDSTLYLPRILCLHGGGTNAIIFHAQCRSLEKALKPTFRLCFAEAPFHSQPGSDVTSVYKDFGPFKAWLCWQPEYPDRLVKNAVEQIEGSLRNAMSEDDEKGATGEWVGLMGFSEGAKMCASLLYMQQMCATKFGGYSSIGPSFQFAVLIAGRAPLVSMTIQLGNTTGLIDEASMSDAICSDDHGLTIMPELLELPTIHVHGMRDPGLHLHRRLLHQYCDEGRTRLIEWDGDHRVPIKTKEVAAVVEEIISVFRDTQVLRG